jgi:hypothetical protein
MKICRYFTQGLIAALVSTIAASPVRAGLDLSPQTVPYEIDGVTMSQLAFENGKNEKASYQPPRDWKYSGGTDHLDLQPPHVAQANIRVTKWPATKQISLDEEGRQQLIDLAIASLPEKSQNVKIESQEMNPLKIDGKQTFLVEVSYTSFGEKFCCYSLFLDRKPEPLCFRLSCREAQYQQLRQLFQRSLYTWQNL